MSRFDAGHDVLPDWVRAALPSTIAEVSGEIADHLRPVEEALSPETMRAMARTRLSFANTLIERMTTHRWSIELTHCDVDTDGLGFLAYEINAEGTRMHFGAFAYPPLPLGHQRLFRDNKTDFFGALIEGPVDVERLRREREQFDNDVWRGRTDARVYGWTVANRGTRTFGNVVDALAAGEQPDLGELESNGGYIIRNGGYYGNGRMGTRAWQSYATDGAPLAMPYHVDLFCLYLWRQLSFDLADATARARNPHAAALDPDLRRYLGIGNSSGLGTVAALIRWPARLSAYITSREVAFAYVLSRPGPVTEQQRTQLTELLLRAEGAYAHAPEPTASLVEPRRDVAQTLKRIAKDVSAMDIAAPRPWQELLTRSKTYGSKESTELLRALLLEVHPETAELRRLTAAGMARDCVVDAEMTVAQLISVIEQRLAWALRLDMSDPRNRAYFWYRSEENGENRRGERAIDIGVERETFIDVVGTVRRLYDALRSTPGEHRIGRFLLDEPEYTQAVARTQLAGSSPYSEIPASVCADDFLPSDAIRCFLSVLGIELPSPHSARWVRGVFYRGAPLPEDIGDGSGSDWILPPRPVEAVNR